MMQHAQLWKHMHAQEPDELQKTVQTLDYGLPIMGALAGNPNVKAKDVIKATSAAVADGHLAPSAAVAMISQMPAEPDKLRPWLKERFALNLAAAVHAKAALMAQTNAPREAPQGAAPQPMPPGGTTP